MSRQLQSYVTLLLIGMTAFTGCHPTQPFYFHSDGDLSHYLDRATEVEYPDVHTASLPDATSSHAPLTITNPEFNEIWDLTLEEAISIALHNSKVIRNLGGVTPFGFADALVGRTSGSPTVYDPAIQETAPSGTATGAAPVNRVTANQAGGVESALADFDALFRVTGSQGGALLNRSDRALNRFIQIPVPGQTPFPDFTDRYDGGLRTDLVKKSATGARFSVANQTDYARWNGPWANPGDAGQKLPSTWTTSFEVRWDQPLLRGRGTMINRIPIILARINTDISLASFESSVRNMVLDVENTYWDLHRAYRDLETAKIGRDASQVTWKQAYEKELQGTLGKQEEAQAREQYFNFRARVEQSLQQLYDREAQIRWLMGIAASDGRLIRPVDEPTMARVDFEWNAVRVETLLRSPELRQKKWLIKQRELELVSAKNQLLPQLDVGALYRWTGTGDHLFGSADEKFQGAGNDGEGSTAMSELASGQWQEAALFFNFAMPVGFRSALAGVRNAQLQLAREKAQLEDTELNAIHLLNTAVRRLDANYVLAQTHFNRWSAAEVDVDAAQAKYEIGARDGTLDLVLEAQRRRSQAQFDYYNSLIEYNKAIAEVHFRKGSLLEYNNIELAEGPWPQKAYWDALGRARERDASYYLDYGHTRPGVVSQGPAPGSVQGMPIEGWMGPEVVPTPQPTPAGSKPSLPAPEWDGTPGQLPSPEAMGPVTRVQDAAPANSTAQRKSPVIQTAAEIDNPLRKSFAWGSLGLDGGAVNGSPVQPAVHTAEITDGK
ncbi:MAG: TolC family protein [Pirellulaceae bacterium]|nr:TolC family protein [Pirellulaceae bacterium]